MAHVGDKLILTALVSIASFNVTFIKVSTSTSTPLMLSPDFNSTRVGWPLAAVNR
jgi:hypothetical protein